MKPKSPATGRTLRQFRASVTTRRKMASLRVSSQRRRDFDESPSFALRYSAIFAEPPAESNLTRAGYRLDDARAREIC